MPHRFQVAPVNSSVMVDHSFDQISSRGSVERVPIIRFIEPGADDQDQSVDGPRMRRHPGRKISKTRREHIEIRVIQNTARAFAVRVG